MCGRSGNSMGKTPELVHQRPELKPGYEMLKRDTSWCSVKVVREKIVGEEWHGIFTADSEIFCYERWKDIEACRWCVVLDKGKLTEFQDLIKRAAFFSQYTVRWDCSVCCIFYCGDFVYLPIFAYYLSKYPDTMEVMLDYYYLLCSNFFNFDLLFICFAPSTKPRLPNN